MVFFSRRGRNNRWDNSPGRLLPVLDDRIERLAERVYNDKRRPIGRLFELPGLS